MAPYRPLTEISLLAADRTGYLSPLLPFQGKTLMTSLSDPLCLVRPRAEVSYFFDWIGEAFRPEARCYLEMSWLTRRLEDKRFLNPGQPLITMMTGLLKAAESDPRAEKATMVQFDPA